MNRYMDMQQRLKGFEAVWQRVTQSKGAPPRPVGAELMPKKKSRSRAIRFDTGGS